MPVLLPRGRLAALSFAVMASQAFITAEQTGGGLGWSRRRRRRREAAVAELDRDIGQRNAQPFGRHLADDRVGTGADLVRARSARAPCRRRAAARARRRRRHGSDRPRWRSPSRSASRRRASSRASRCAATSRRPSRLRRSTVISERLDHCLPVASFIESLTRRSSIGSMSSLIASSSIALSSA